MKQLLNIYLNFYNTIYTPLTNLVVCFNQTKLLYLIIKLIPISFIFQLNKSLNFLILFLIITLTDYIVIRKS